MEGIDNSREGIHLLENVLANKVYCRRPVLHAAIEAI